MTTSCPVPARASLRDLLRDLLGTEIQVRDGDSPQQLDPARPSWLAGYRFDEGGVAAIGVCDLRLSTATATALAAMPAKDTWDQVREAGQLVDDLQEFLREVVNISAKLLNSPTTPHVALRDHLAVPGEVPADVAHLAMHPTERHDWVVSIEGHGEGTFTLLA